MIVMIGGLHRRALRIPLSLIAITAFALVTPASAPAQVAGAQTGFIFSGGGWGHGIGLSQYGAKGYAEQGWTYDRILRHFYQGTRLETTASVTVRVNLDREKKARNRWRIQASTDTTLTFVQTSDTSIAVSVRETTTAGAPAIYWITTLNGDTRLHADAGGVPGRIIRAFDGRSYVRSSSPIRIVDRSGPFDHTNVAWRGRLHFIPASEVASQSYCVNYVPMEDYLRGVVPRESPSSWPAEALKAQAVAARSYAYTDWLQGRVLWCTTMSQVYNGAFRPGYDHEPASTDAAVAATRGQIVWYKGTYGGRYHSEPVRTYFSSSSGGHTANIQDVWFSTPKPYYTGVPDADRSGNPYYTWTVGPLSTSDAVINGTTVKGVSTLVREKVGSSLSAPAPHVIVGMTLERASTGHVRYVTCVWSNGERYRIKGDTLRSALGLRSTKFTVVVRSPVTTFSETNGNLAWAGPWRQVADASAYDGGYRRTSVPRSQAIVRFRGSGIAWSGTKGPGLGKAVVRLDGVTVATVDLYAPKKTPRQVLFSRTGLASTEHTLTITVVKEKNSRSTGYGATLDRVSVTGGGLLKAATPVVRYDEAGPYVAELGGWSREETAAAYKGAHILNARAGASVVVRFYGSRISWIGMRGPGLGQAKVRIDDSAPVTVTLEATRTAHQQQLFTSGPLSTAAPHQLTISIPAIAPTSSPIAVDAFDVTAGWVIPPLLPRTVVQESSLPRAGHWTMYRNRAASGGVHMVSGSRGASATLVFEGSAATWYGARTRWYGKAEVLLDGRRVATVDLYAPSTMLDQRIWSVAGLPAKRHTLTIRVLGTKRDAALGTLVSIDHIDIRGRVAPR